VYIWSIWWAWEAVSKVNGANLSTLVIVSPQWRPQDFFTGRNIVGARFDNDGAGNNEGAESNNRTAKSVSILKCFKFLKVIFIATYC